MTTISRIGDSAQSALQPLRGYGGPAYLDDGRCAVWVDVANTSRGPGNWWSGGQSNYVAHNVPMARGTVCQIYDAWNRGERIFTLDNNGWGVIIQPRGGFTVKPAPNTNWRTRARTAINLAFAVSPGPSLTAFSPVQAPSLAGVELLSNQYRVR